VTPQEREPVAVAWEDMSYWAQLKFAVRFLGMLFIIGCLGLVAAGVVIGMVLLVGAWLLGVL
jgi:hypothetical protein